MVEFSEHAIDTIKKRKIPKRAIINTINNPEEILVSYRGILFRVTDTNDVIARSVNDEAIPTGQPIFQRDRHALRARDDIV